MSSETLIAGLEDLSRQRPDRVLRVSGLVSVAAEDPEPFELIIYRGFSSSTTHPTDVDPDRPVLPVGVRLETAELLAGPLDPTRVEVLAGPAALETFLDPQAW